MIRGNLWALARDKGITLKSGWEHSPAASRVRTTYAKRTLRRLIDRHGEDHVGKVLDAILGDEKGHPRKREGNAAELYGATLSAVSGLLSKHPQLGEGRVHDLLTDIDLGALRRRAIRMNTGPVPQTMLTLLAVALVSDEVDESWIREEAA